MDMPTRFLHVTTWSRTRSWRSLCDKVVFLVIVFILVVLSGSCTDNSVFVTAAPFGRATPSGGIRSGSGGVSKSCPEEDVGVKTYLAQTVFEGKARSRSPVRDGVYNVTFVVQKVHKGLDPRFLRSPVRLQFAEKATASNNNFQKCNDEGDKNSVMRANIKRGGKYIVFVDKIEQHIFKARGEPVKRNEKTVKAVKDILCQNCVRPPSITGLHDISLKPKEKLNRVCRVKGNPLPVIQWYKDGVRVLPSRKIRIHTKKRRSTLLIPKVRPEDAGLYRCEAKSVIGVIANMTARVTVISDTRPENTTTLWPLYGMPCPVETFCLNGGTCFYYETVGELVCQCADGYKGQRCENKDVSNRGNVRKGSWALDASTRMLPFH
ncbi:pro-neuregulin-2, membrane-bound isoform-like isoform X3 [Zootermopsis nevadensis]|uniref:pro-neuregulin-2, membrane-bound isoform-like isoform X3 n=1 Tax=Zootermopsis nevadensis TaxID=136037 RepID=UPI000B8EDE3A|nr:pro-neuregulin-2, membrane-bound isoform-like isoform X3 [Zootermopsis nevadensis]XP_021917309.1 pro-neuregulin-2, membrane-bound isoform-like isoform X3 [Zootermopsis nevadensis]